jgi:glutamate formiminotransferase
VANFSEGRDEKIVASIADSIDQAPRVAVLGRAQDYDHNRAVITFAGPPDFIADAALRGITRAVELIDLNRHEGVHPRLGAGDVVPFVPIEGVTLQDCAHIAVEVGERVWQQLRVPVYLYEAAATRPERVNLANVRRGGFEPMRDEVRINPERIPDIGTAELHPTAGACIIGARRLLIAFNINLATDNVEIARQIARKIRFSSGGLPGVKALGLFLPSRGLAQVSTNLTDFERTPPAAVFEAVRTEADRAGVGIVGSEIVGLIPRKALEMSAGCDMHLQNFRPDLVLENQLAALLPGLG